MADVFISYSQRAPEPTHALAAALVQHGIDAWFDINLLPGDAFGKVLNDEIDRAKAVITIWSRPALASTWVPAESQRAMSQNKLLCVRTADVDANELPIPFNNLQTPLVTDIDALLAGLARKGIRRGNASLGGLRAEHGTMGEAAIAWHSVKDSMEPSEVEAFLEFYYSAAFYRLLATRKLERMRGPAAQSKAPPVVRIARPEDVFLRIEPGMHTATIRRISLTPDGRIMATASDDKTVRLWTLPSGELMRTLRPFVGAGHEGKVYAVALEPDGKWLAAAGWDAAWTASQQVFVMIFDTATGVITNRLGPLPGAVLDLELSANGERLAAGIGNSAGVRVWETKTWRQVAEDRDYRGDVYGLAYAEDGRLAATGWDGQIRLYAPDGRLAKKVAGGPKPNCVAFSPDGGTRLVVGYEGMTRVDVLSGHTLAPVLSADTSSIHADLFAATWLADSERIAAAGRYAAQGQFPVLVWGDGGRGQAQIFPGSGGTVMDLSPWGAGLAFGAHDPAFGLVDANGKRVLFRGPPMADMRNKTGDHFLVSSDGQRARFGLKPFSEDPWLFDLADLKLTPSPTPPAGLHAANVTSLNVADWQNSTAPKLDGNPLTLKPHETAFSLAIAPDARGFALGTHFCLRYVSSSGKQAWEKPAAGIVWGVNLARDGRLILAACGDGTIRWHRASDGQELLALFIHVPEDPKAAKRWVLWTPEGYYTASPGGEDLIGWHVNRGHDQAADFYPAETFRSTFHRPDIVLKALDKAEVVAAPVT
jgi:WD40 repeat protein